MHDERMLWLLEHFVKLLPSALPVCVKNSLLAHVVLESLLLEKVFVDFLEVQHLFVATPDVISDHQAREMGTINEHDP